MTDPATSQELVEGLKQARAVVIAFQNRFSNDARIAQKAARAYSQIVHLECYAKRVAEPL